MLKKDVKNYYFILKLVATIFFVLTAYLTNSSIIKIVALISLLIVINFESINKLWSKYKIKRNDNPQK